MPLDGRADMVRFPLLHARRGIVAALRRLQPVWPRPFLPCFRKICTFPTLFPAGGSIFEKKVLFLHCFHEALPREILGVPGFDSRQSLIVSTPSAVWRLVNPDTQDSNGNNSYALAA